jgi:hypothetical protein
MLSGVGVLVFPPIYFLWRSLQLKAGLRFEAGSEQRAYCMNEISPPETIPRTWAIAAAAWECW